MTITIESLTELLKTDPFLKQIHPSQLKRLAESQWEQYREFLWNTWSTVVKSVLQTAVKNKDNDTIMAALSSESFVKTHSNTIDSVVGYDSTNTVGLKFTEEQIEQISGLMFVDDKKMNSYYFTRFLLKSGQITKEGFKWYAEHCPISQEYVTPNFHLIDEEYYLELIKDRHWREMLDLHPLTLDKHNELYNKLKAREEKRQLRYKESMVKKRLETLTDDKTIVKTLWERFNRKHFKGALEVVLQKKKEANDKVFFKMLVLELLSSDLSSVYTRLEFLSEYVNIHEVLKDLANTMTVDEFKTLIRWHSGQLLFNIALLPFISDSVLTKAMLCKETQSWAKKEHERRKEAHIEIKEAVSK